jgi:DNA-binding XRE family transcriptional regulator
MSLAISYFTTPTGDEMAVLPRSDLERLCGIVEDVEDVRAFDAAMEALESGEDELLPEAFVDALMETDCPLREWREYRGMTQAALSEASGVRQATISGIEKKGSEPALKTARALAAALGVDVDDLF